jgi:hypothetical protein
MGARAEARAPGQASRYGGIIARNAFGLQTRPVIPVVSPTLPRIALTGITTVLGDKRALLRVNTPAAPSEAAREETYILTEGQRAGELQVLEINELAGNVKVAVAGRVVTVAFK